MASVVSTRRQMRAFVAAPEQPAKPTTALVVRTTGASRSGEGRPVAMGGTTIERSLVSPGSLAIYSVKPIGTAEWIKGKKSMLYAVYVQNAITGRSWVVHRRYSDFLTLRTLITEHFQLFNGQFSRLEELVGELYFPRKHKFRSKMGSVIEHRCDAFLEYLVGLHRLLISQAYLQRPEVSTIGLSILRGFLGSSIVQDSNHKNYIYHKPILPNALNPSERTPVNQCGSLQTVLEDDSECEHEEHEVDAEKTCTGDESTDGTDMESADESTDMEEPDECDVRESEFDITRLRSKKYSRNRHSLLFLKKDYFIKEHSLSE